MELMTAVISKNTVKRTTQSEKVLKTTDLSRLFGIELDKIPSSEKDKRKSLKNKSGNPPPRATNSKTRTKMAHKKKL